MGHLFVWPGQTFQQLSQARANLEKGKRERERGILKERKEEKRERIEERMENRGKALLIQKLNSQTGTTLNDLCESAKWANNVVE